MSSLVYALVDDLLFASKLDTAARGLGATLVLFQSREELLADVRQRRPEVIILDLDAEHLGPGQLLKDLAEDNEGRSVATVGYCSHVNVLVMEAAERLGCGRVLSRSAFTANLPAILTNQPS